MILRKIYRRPGFPCKNITNKVSLIENKDILVFPLNLQIWFHNINVDVLDPEQDLVFRPRGIFVSDSGTGWKSLMINVK